MVPTVARVTLPKPCAAFRIGASGSSSPSVPFLARIGHDGVQKRAEILHVDQREPVVIGDAERDVENALLHVVQIEHARKQ